MARQIEEDYNISAVSMTSWAFPTIAAWVSDAAIALMQADERIDRIYPSLVERFSASPPWSDIPGTEFTSYGKVAMDMNDSLGAGTRVYMVDAGIDTSVPLNVDWAAMSQAPIGSLCTAALGHSAHVLGILTATHNSQVIKGMNNGGPVTSVRKGCTDTGAETALDWIVADTEAAGTYSVVNISANGHAYSHDGGAGRFMRKASSRNLIVHSAGNFNEDACDKAFSPTKKGDGILVVGAVDSTGARATSWDNSASGYGNGSSSYGSCVEVWAPGEDIRSTWTGSTTANMVMSGTSMAAPHVAAMAARYGTSTSHPVLREAFIRSKLFSTGSTDPNGLTIYVPSYTQTPTFTLPSKISSLASVSASSTYLTYTAGNAMDGNYLTTSWNSGVTPNYPSVQPWYQLDFESTRSLWSIRLMPSQTPSGVSTHEIYVGNSSPPTTLAATITRDTMNGEMVATDLTGYSARYVRVVARANPGWAAYYEVEVFGY